MATSGQLKSLLKEKRLDAFWQVDQARGFTGTYEEWLEGASPYIDKFSQADAEAIFEFLTDYIRVESGIAVSIDAGIDGYVIGQPTVRTVTDEQGAGATTEQGRLV